MLVPPNQKKQVKKTDKQMMDAFKDAVDQGIPVDPELPDNWDCLAHEARPSCHMIAWGQPYIVTESEPNERYRESWLKAWPTGVRYDVRRLDGGAWDRSTNCGSFASLEDAIAVAEELGNESCSSRASFGF